jgi:hypothetical protein
MAKESLYPDVLGHITTAERLDLGLVQVVAACLPSVVRVGKSFRTILLLQSAVDAPVELVVTLGLPAVDSVGKRGQFSAKMLRIGVGMLAGEVGMVVLPVVSLPDTAPGAVRLTLTIVSIKALERGERVRAPSGGAPLYLDGLRPETRKTLENLGKLRYVGGKKSVLTGEATLQPTVMLEPGGLGEVVDLKPEYRTLWTYADLREDPLVLLERFKDDLTQHALPSIDRVKMLAPLTEKAQQRFEQAGYPLKPIEAMLIGRALTNVLEYACTGQMSYGRTYLPQRDYEVLPIINQYPHQRQPLRLRWLEAVLNALAEDVRVARYMSRAMVRDVIFDALLHDTVYWAMVTVEVATGIELGTSEEMAVLAQQWMTKFQHGIETDGFEGISFVDVYVPLVLAGLIVYDEMLLPDEDLRAFNPQFQVMLRERADERTDDNEPVFALVSAQLDKTLRKYGLGLL